MFEALASLHIQRLTFQFVHCRSFRVRRRPCLESESQTLSEGLTLSDRGIGFYPQQGGYLIPPQKFKEGVVSDLMLLYRSLTYTGVVLTWVELSKTG